MAHASAIPIPTVVSFAYPVLRSCSARFLGNHGGFSGARLWHISSDGRDYCLRAWPLGRMDQRRLQGIHLLMKQSRSLGLEVVPEIRLLHQADDVKASLPRERGEDVAKTPPAYAGGSLSRNLRSDGASFLFRDDRFWEMTSWMPGRACFDESPTNEKLRDAFTTLARLHHCWQDRSLGSAPCPALARRQKSLDDWQRRVHSRWRPDFAARGNEVGIVAEKAWRLLSQWTPRLPSAILPWMNQPFPVQMCLCDIWHDHLLFEGNKLTGLIDFGSVKCDHVAVDLARMLGSLVQDDMDQRRYALDVYCKIRPLTNEEIALVDVLDRTGTVLAMANWLTWLYWDNRLFDDYAAVATRMTQLVTRIEKWG